jgi:hypothetical protein
MKYKISQSDKSYFIYTSGGKEIAEVYKEEDALLICKYLNNYDKLLAACEIAKQRIHFIGLPSEPMNENGPDWSKEIAIIEQAISDCKVKK